MQPNTILGLRNYNNINYTSSSPKVSSEFNLEKPFKLTPVPHTPIDIPLHNNNFTSCWLNSALKFASKTGIFDKFFSSQVDDIIQKKIALREKIFVDSKASRKDSVNETLEKFKSWLCENSSFFTSPEKDLKHLDVLISWCHSLCAFNLEEKLKFFKINSLDLSYEEFFDVIFNIDVDEVFEKNELKEIELRNKYILDLKNKLSCFEDLHNYLFAAIEYIRTHSIDNPEETEMLKDLLLVAYMECFNKHYIQNEQFDGSEFIQDILQTFSEELLHVYAPDIRFSGDILKDYRQNNIDDNLYIQPQRLSDQGQYIGTKLIIDDFPIIDCIDSKETDKIGVPNPRKVKYEVKSAIVYFSTQIDNFESQGHYVFVERCENLFLLHNDSQILEISKNDFMSYVASASMLHLNKISTWMPVPVSTPVLKLKLGLEVQKDNYLETLSLIETKYISLFGEKIDPNEFEYFMKPKSLKPHSSAGIRLITDLHINGYDWVYSFLKFAAASGIIDDLFHTLPIEKNEYMINQFLFAAIQALRQTPEQGEFYTSDNCRLQTLLLIESLKRSQNSTLSSQTNILEYMTKSSTITFNKNCITIFSETFGNDIFKTISVRENTPSIYLNIRSLYDRKPINIPENGIVKICGQSYKIQTLMVYLDPIKKFCVYENTMFQGRRQFIQHDGSETFEISSTYFFKMAALSDIIHLEKI